MNNEEIENRIEKLEEETEEFRLHIHDGITSLVLSPKNLQGGYLLNPVTVTTSGTTPVNVFGGLSATSNRNNTPFNLTIKAIYLICLDSTAGNITISNSGNTIATIAKGVVPGLMTGAVSLANTLVTITNQFTTVSSSAGNAQVIIIYQAN